MAAAVAAIAMMTAAIIFWAARTGRDDLRLSWAPPRLEDPVTISVPVRGGQFELDPGRDYQVVLARAPVTGAVSLVGGHNVVLVGGELDFDGGAPGVLYFKNFTGTLHVEGLRIDPGGSRGIEADAIRVASTADGSTAQFENIYVRRVGGSYDGVHGDLIQTWGGPSRLRVDRFTGYSDYQGLYLAPNDADWHARVVAMEFRNMDLHGVDDGTFNMLYDISGRGGEPPTPVQHNLWAAVDHGSKIANEQWSIGSVDGIRRGDANGKPGAQFVDPSTVGIGYRSPGYR